MPVVLVVQALRVQAPLVVLELLQRYQVAASPCQHTVAAVVLISQAMPLVAWAGLAVALEVLVRMAATQLEWLTPGQQAVCLILVPPMILTQANTLSTVDTEIL